MLRRQAKPPDPDDDILIADGGAEQCLLGVIWRVLKTTGRYVRLLGPLAGRHNEAILQVVTAAAKLIDERGKKYCAIVHEGLLDRDPEQKSLSWLRRKSDMQEMPLMIVIAKH